jgi:hypothetical protein
MFALKSNRCVSLEKGKWVQVQKLEIPDEGLEVWLRGVGQVKLFRQQLKDELRHYVIHLPDAAQLSNIDRKAFCDLPDRHWIESSIIARLNKFTILSIFRFAAK